MEDIFQKKKRRRPLARIGAAFFALLAVVSLVEAFRAAPIPTGDSTQVVGVEAVLYRLAAAAFCGGMSVWMLTWQKRKRRDEAELLRR